MDYDFLFDASRHLLTIGYNVQERRMDASCYDLLASEARLASFVGIAQGALPKESWFALGRLLKAREDCKVVFIGPCVAKKAEARRPELQDAVDCVLTFKETETLFKAAEVDISSIGEDVPMEDASYDGRIYARTEGVTTAIVRAVQRIDPIIEVNAVHGDGIKECMTLLKLVEQGKLAANFMEGMGCEGGCVGGPGTIIPREEGRRNVNSFAKTSSAVSALDNHKAERWMLELGSKVDLTTGRQAGTKPVEAQR